MVYVKRWYLNNLLRNYNYLIVNSVKQTSLIIDPTIAENYESFLTKNAFVRVEAILLTHSHNDHIAAASKLKIKYRIPVYAGFNYYNNNKVDHVVHESEIIPFKTSACRVIDCPGHIASHVSFYFPNQSMLFCGDTIFAAGIGNVKDNTANILSLYNTITKLRKLPQFTKLYPAHDYFENNLSFAISIDPSDHNYKTWLRQISNKSPLKRPITTFSDENRMNIFFKTNELRLQNILNNKNQDVVDSKSAFCKLRALKDNFR